MTCVRRRPRRRGARTSTDLPQREQRSRSERSSKPQWGHVREGTSVIVGGIDLTSVDIVTGSCQCPPSWIASTPARSPRGVRGRPDGWPTCRPSSTPSGTSTATATRSGPRPAPTATGCAPGFHGAPSAARPRARARAARRAAGAVPGPSRLRRGARGARRPRRDREHRRPRGGADAEPARRRARARGDGPDAACALVLAIVFVARAEGTLRRLKVCPHAHCGWAFYDFSRNRSGQWCSMRICGNRTKGEAFDAAPARADPDRTDSNPRGLRFTVTPRSRPSAERPDTLSHDAMAARLQSSLASAATRALGVRPRHLERHRVVLNDDAAHDAARRHPTTSGARVPRVVRLPAPTPLERWCREHARH